MRKDIYVVAFLALVLLGVSAAWAQYSANPFTGTITTEDLVTINTQDNPSFTVYKGWVKYTTAINLATITVDASASNVPVIVRVALLNAKDLKSVFTFLVLEVKLYDSSNKQLGVNYITLTRGEVIVTNSTNSITVSGGDYTLKITSVWGYAWRSATVNPLFYVEVEEAG